MHQETLLCKLELSTIWITYVDLFGMGQSYSWVLSHKLTHLHIWQIVHKKELFSQSQTSSKICRSAHVDVATCMHKK